MTDQTAAAAKATASTMMRYDENKKSMVVSYLLWFFLGMLGAHRFFLGQKHSAVAQLALFIVGLVTSFLGVGLIVLGGLAIWVIVDAFLIPGWVTEHNNNLAASLSA